MFRLNRPLFLVALLVAAQATGAHAQISVDPKVCKAERDAAYQSCRDAAGDCSARCGQLPGPGCEELPPGTDVSPCQALCENFHGFCRNGVRNDYERCMNGETTVPWFGGVINGKECTGARSCDDGVASSGFAPSETKPSLGGARSLAELSSQLEPLPETPRERAFRECLDICRRAGANCREFAACRDNITFPCEPEGEAFCEVYCYDKHGPRY